MKLQPRSEMELLAPDTRVKSFHVPKRKENAPGKQSEKQQKSTCTFCQVVADVAVALILWGESVEFPAGRRRRVMGSSPISGAST